MEHERLFTKLRDFGLNSYETKLWVSLLSGGILTAGELSDIANVPRSRSYDVLESLRKKGFVFIEQGKPIKYRAIQPEMVIKNIKERVKERAHEQIKLIDDLKTKKLFKELENIHNQSLEISEPEQFVGSFKDKTNIKNQLQYMVKNTKKFVYIAETLEGLNTNIDFLMKNLPILERKGIDVKVMVNTEKNVSEKFKNLKIKNTKLKNRFCIVDGKEMLFMLFNEYDIGILVNTKTFIKSVTELFNKQWTNSNFIV